MPAGAQSAPIDRLDVLGIKIGMPVAQAQKIIAGVYKDKVNEHFDIIHTANPSSYDQGPPNGPSLRARYTANNGSLVVIAGPPLTASDMTTRAEMYDNGEITRDEETGPLTRWQGLTDKIVLDLRGAGGAETVAMISRGTVYPQGQQPTVDATIAALEAKYGAEPSQDMGAPGLRLLTWYYDPRHRFIASTSPSWQARCVASSGYVRDLSRQEPVSPAGAISGCGIFVSAAIVSSATNPALVGYIGTILDDNQTLYDALEERQDFFANIKAALQRQETQDAAKAGIKPAL